MRVNGPQRRVHTGNQALSFPQGITEQQASLARLLIGTPPGIEVREDGCLGRPAINRQAEGGLGNERVAADRFKGRAGWVRLEFVIARDNPDLSLVLDA